MDGLLLQHCRTNHSTCRPRTPLAGEAGPTHQNTDSSIIPSLSHVVHIPICVYIYINLTQTNNLNWSYVGRTRVHSPHPCNLPLTSHWPVYVELMKMNFFFQLTRKRKMRERDCNKDESSGSGEFTHVRSRSWVPDQFNWLVRYGWERELLVAPYFSLSALHLRKNKLSNIPIFSLTTLYLKKAQTTPSSYIIVSTLQW